MHTPLIKQDEQTFSYQRMPWLFLVTVITLAMVTYSAYNNHLGWEQEVGADDTTWDKMDYNPFEVIISMNGKRKLGLTDSSYICPDEMEPFRPAKIVPIENRAGLENPPLDIVDIAMSPLKIGENAKEIPFITKGMYNDPAGVFIHKFFACKAIQVENGDFKKPPGEMWSKVCKWGLGGIPMSAAKGTKKVFSDDSGQKDLYMCSMSMILDEAKKLNSNTKNIKRDALTTGLWLGFYSAAVVMAPITLGVKAIMAAVGVFAGKGIPWYWKWKDYNTEEAKKKEEIMGAFWNRVNGGLDQWFYIGCPKKATDEGPDSETNGKRCTEYFQKHLVDGISFDQSFLDKKSKQPDFFLERNGKLSRVEMAENENLRTLKRQGYIQTQVNALLEANNLPLEDEYWRKQGANFMGAMLKNWKGDANSEYTGARIVVQDKGLHAGNLKSKTDHSNLYKEAEEAKKKAEEVEEKQKVLQNEANRLKEEKK